MLAKNSFQDIDECGRTSGVCSNGVCENMMGAYQCVCDEGFKQVNQDISTEFILSKLKHYKLLNL